MIRIRQHITIDHRLTVKDWNAITPGMWEMAGEYWHENILKKHFEPGAAAEYGYRRRSAAYQARKLKETGQNAPLVNTGRLRDELLGSATIRMRNARGGGASIGMRASYTKPYAKEIRAMSQRDDDDITKQVADYVEVELNKPGRPRRIEA